MNKGAADSRPVLVVEDSDDDFDTVVAAAELADVRNRLVRAVDASAAIALLANGHAHDFSFMLLDYKLPGRDGLSLLLEVRGDPRLAHLPAIVFTTSTNPQDRAVFYGSGANAFHVKEVQYFDSLRTLKAIFDYWLKRVELPQSADALAS